MRSPRHLAAAALLLAAACVVDVQFEIPKKVAVSASDTHFAATAQVDLGEYGPVRDHRAQVQTLDLRRVVVAVEDLSAGEGATLTGAALTIVDGAQTYRYTAAAAQPSPIVLARGATCTLADFTAVGGARPLGDLLVALLQAGAPFTVSVEGTLSQPVTAELTVTLVADLGYGI
jgi:hypothetical protein